MGFLDVCILLAVCIVEIFIFYDFFNNFFLTRKRFSNLKAQIIISMGAILLLFITNMLENPFINLAMIPVLFWIYSSILFEAKISIRFGYILLAMVLFIGGEFSLAVLQGPSHLISGRLSVMDLQGAPWQLFTMKLLTYASFCILRQFSNKSKNRMYKKIFLVFLCIPLASIGAMVLSYYLGVDGSNQWEVQIFISLIFFLAIVGNISLFYIFLKYSEELYQSKKSQSQIHIQDLNLVHYKHLERVSERQDIFLHDIEKQLRTTEELIRLKNWNNAESMISVLENELEENKKSMYSKNSVLNAVLLGYQKIAIENKVTFNVYVEAYLNIESITDIDLSSILGNLLENAIRGAKSSYGEKMVWVRIFMQDSGRTVVLKVVNTFLNEIKKSQGKLLSTKNEKGKHGLGLKSIEKSLKKYDGHLNYFIQENLFTAVVIFPVHY